MGSYFKSSKVLDVKYEDSNYSDTSYFGRFDCLSYDVESDYFSTEPNREAEYGQRRFDTRISRCSSGTRGNWYNYHITHYGVTFFIEERKKHYRNINHNVLLQLGNLGSKSEGNFLDRLSYRTYAGTSSVYYNQAKLHIEKQSKGLTTRIDTLLTDIGNHNESVENLKKTVEQEIKKAFLVPSTGSVTEYYEYFFNNIFKAVTDLWHQNIEQSDLDSEIITNKIDSYLPRLGVRIFANHVERSGSTLAVGKDENEASKIKEIIEKRIFKNQNILNEITKINESLRSLNKLSEEIASVTKQISASIDDDSYLDKAKCCPPVWSLIRKYVLT